MRGLNSKEKARTEPADEPYDGLGADGGDESKRARRRDGVGQVDGGTEAESAAQHMEVSIEHIFESDQGKEGKPRCQEDEGMPDGRRMVMEKAHEQLPLEES